jgi:hypothetical protein
MLRDISHGAGLKSTGHDNASDKAKQNVPSSAGRGFFRRFENIPFLLSLSPSLCPPTARDKESVYLSSYIVVGQYGHSHSFHFPNIRLLHSSFMLQTM